eukprot:4702697-Pyramimonas_sp.AAC.1
MHKSRIRSSNMLLLLLRRGSWQSHKHFPDGICKPYASTSARRIPQTAVTLSTCLLRNWACGLVCGGYVVALVA